MDYYLPKEDMKFIIEISDVNGGIIAFQNDSTSISEAEELPKAVRDMATEFTSKLYSSKLTNNKGWNRFSWDMTMPGPWNKQKGRRYRNGPLVKPGKYKVSFSVADTYVVTEFEIVPDPRVLESGVSPEDIASQVDFQIKIRDKYSETLQLQEKLEQQLKALEKNGAASEEKKTKKSIMEKALSQIKTSEGIYQQPMLAAQWRYLYSMMNEADQVPGKDAYERFDELASWLEKVKTEVQ